MIFQLNRYPFDELQGDYNIPSIVDESDLIGEPVLQRASPEFVMAEGGRLTQEIMLAMMEHDCFKGWMERGESKGYRLSICARTTRTIKGQYPSVQGWHCDDVPKCDDSKYPDFSRMDEDMSHFVAIVASAENHSCTEYIVDPFDLDDLDDTSRIYELLEKRANAGVDLGQLQTKNIEPGKLYRYSCSSVHRPVPANNTGWRMFFKAGILPIEPMNHKKIQFKKWEDLFPPGQRNRG